MSIIADRGPDGILRNVRVAAEGVRYDPEPGCTRVRLAAWPTGEGPFRDRAHPEDARVRVAYSDPDDAHKRARALEAAREAVARERAALDNPELFP